MRFNCNRLFERLAFSSGARRARTFRFRAHSTASDGSGAPFESIGDWKGLQGIVLLASTHLGAYGLYKYRQRIGEGQSFIFEYAMSLARLGYLGPEVFVPDHVGHFLGPHITSTFVNTSALQCVANVVGSSWFGWKLLQPGVPHPLRALLSIYGLSGIVAAGYARDEHVRALEGWLRIAHEEDYTRLTEAGDRDGLTKAVAKAAMDNEDTKLIAYYPTYGAMPAMLGLATFTALELARKQPMFAVGVSPLIMSAALLGLLPPADVPPLLATLNTFLGATTFATNAVGAGTGAGLWIGYRLGRFLLSRSSAVSKAGKAAANAAARGS